MKASFTRFLCTLCAMAMLLAPAAALAEGEQEPMELNIGSNPQAYFIVPGDRLDTGDLRLNGIPYKTQLNPLGNVIMRTGDLLAAKVVGELPNVEPSAFQIKNGKILLNTPKEGQGEAAPPPTAGAETDPNDNPFQYVEDRTSDERLSYPEDVIKKYAQALIDGVADLIKVLESEDVLMEYRNSDGSFSGKPAQDADLPALLTYVTSILSGDPVTAEAFDNAMYAIYSKLCALDYKAGNTAVPISGNKARLNTSDSLLMLTFRTVMEQSGYSLPWYLSISDLGVRNPVHQGPWRESDYGKLDDLATARKKLKGANGFQLKGEGFELSDGQGNKLPLMTKNVWQSPIVKDVDPNEGVPPPPAPVELPPVEAIVASARTTLIRPSATFPPK